MRRRALRSRSDKQPFPPLSHHVKLKEIDFNLIYRVIAPDKRSGAIPETMRFMGGTVDARNAPKNKISKEKRMSNKEKKIKTSPTMQKQTQGRCPHAKNKAKDIAHDVETTSGTRVRCEVQGGREIVVPLVFEFSNTHIKHHLDTIMKKLSGSCRCFSLLPQPSQAVLARSQFSLRQHSSSAPSGDRSAAIGSRSPRLTASS